MEEADAILIEGLNLVGCNVPSEVTSCKALVEEDSSLFYQCCVVLLKLIDESKEFPAKLPRHMSGRVNACNRLVEYVKLGITAHNENEADLLFITLRQGFKLYRRRDTKL